MDDEKPKVAKAFVDRRDGKLKIREVDGSITVPKEKNDRRFTVWNQATKDKIIKLAFNGLTPTQICRELGMHESTIWRWFQKYSGFVEEYENARAMSAYRFEEKILELAENVHDEKDVQVARFKSEIYFKLAKIRSPKVYAEKKVAPEGEGTGNVVINFVTGVPQSRGQQAKSVVSIPVAPTLEDKSDSGLDNSDPDGAA